MKLQFTSKAECAINFAKRYAKSLNQNYIGTEHILLGLLKEKDGVAGNILIENGIDEKKVMKMIKELIAPDHELEMKEKDGYTPRAKKILEESLKQATRFKASEIGTEHILLALIKEGESVAFRLLSILNIPMNKLFIDILVAIGEDTEKYKDEIASSKNSRNSKKKEGTPTLNQYSRDLTAMANSGRLDPVIGRDAEIKRVIQILSRRTKNNPCLIGEAGVGKTAIVEGLALRIAEGNVPESVQNKRVVTLDLSGMVAGSKYRGEFEERIKRVMKEVIEDGMVILFLDEIHTIIGAGGAEGAIDASNILKPSLARGEIQLIGATTIVEYRKYVEKDAALERRFQPVSVEEPNELEAITILKGIVSQYEKHHKVIIAEEAIVAAVKLSQRYINDRNLPDKAIDLLDEAAAALCLKGRKLPASVIELADRIKALELLMEKALTKLEFGEATEYKKEQAQAIKKYDRLKKKYQERDFRNELVVGEEEIAEIVSLWTKIPVQKLAEKESEKLLKLESLLQKMVIGQNEAVSAVSRAMRRGRVGLSDPNRPIGSFLFLGPTGVGKTELSKSLAEIIFGNKDSLIRVDMSEYMEQHSVAKMIGSPPGYVGFEEGGQLSEKVRRNPYSVILFDEIEKAHPDVFNVLLQVLDDGHITDSKGRKVSFKNTVLIMTSNAGAAKIIEPKNLGFTSHSNAEQDYDKMKTGVMEEVKKLFKPEFINRIDEIIVFHSLTKDNMKEIITLLSKNLQKRCKEQMDITLVISPSLKEYIVDKYLNLKMGARPLKRAIQTVIEDALAEEILVGNIKAGDKVSGGYQKNKVIFTKKV